MSEDTDPDELLMAELREVLCRRRSRSAAGNRDGQGVPGLATPRRRPRRASQRLGAGGGALRSGSRRRGAGESGDLHLSRPDDRHRGPRGRPGTHAARTALAPVSRDDRDPDDGRCAALGRGRSARAVQGAFAGRGPNPASGSGDERARPSAGRDQLDHGIATSAGVRRSPAWSGVVRRGPAGPARSGGVRRGPRGDLRGRDPRRHTA